MWFATLFVLGTLPVPADQPFLLRRKFAMAEGERYTYTTETKNSVELPGGAGEQSYSVSLTGTQSYRCVGVDIQGMKIEGTARMDPMKVTGPMAAMMPKSDKPTVVKTLGTLDVLNRLRFANAPVTMPGQTIDASALVAATNGFVFPEFPAELVSIGSSWKVKLPTSTLPSKSASFMNYTLSARESLNGVPALLLLANCEASMSMTQKLPENSGLPGGAEEVGLSTTINLSGKIWIDPVTGRTLRAEIGGTSKTKVSMGRTMSIDSTGEQKTVYIAKL